MLVRQGRCTAEQALGDLMLQFQSPNLFLSHPVETLSTLRIENEHFRRNRGRNEAAKRWHARKRQGQPRQTGHQTRVAISCDSETMAEITGAELTPATPPAIPLTIDMRLSPEQQAEIDAETDRILQDLGAGEGGEGMDE